MNARNLLIAAGLCSLCLLGPAQGQEGPKPKAPQASPPPAVATESEPSAKLLDLDFPGGTAAQYIEAVRKAAGDANVIALGDLSNLQVPAVRLKRVSAYAALHTLELMPVFRGPGSMGVRVNYDGGVITVAGGVAQAEHADQQSLVITVADLLEAKLKAADLLAAIEAALDMLKGRYEPAQIRFHEATGLLIARGAEEQMASVQGVVNEVRGQVSMQRRRQEEKQKAEAVAAELENFKTKLTGLAGELEATQRRAMEAQTRAEMMAKELEEARRALNERQVKIEEMMRELAARSHQPQPKPQ